MDNNKIISVIVPIYNCENYLEKCINSIVNQTYFNLEIILIDDGSTDNSAKIMRKFQQKDSRIVCLYQINQGVSSARKRGVEYAHGKYLMFVDADDYIDENMCAKMHAKFVVGVDIVSCRLRKIWKNGMTQDMPEMNGGIYSGRYRADNIITTNYFYDWISNIYLCGAIFKTYMVKDVFDRIDVTIDFSEDYMCYILILLMAKRVYLLEDYFYFYRQNLLSAVHNHKKERLDSQKKLYHFLQKQFIKLNASGNIHKQLETVIMLNLLSTGSRIFDEKKYLYPYKDIYDTSNLVIYGAGNFGSVLIERMERKKWKAPYIWVDKNWKIKQKEGLEVLSVDAIDCFEYEYIIIAILSYKVSHQVRYELIQKGIDEKKIVLVSQELINLNEVLEDFIDENIGNVLTSIS